MNKQFFTLVVALFALTWLGCFPPNNPQPNDGSTRYYDFAYGNDARHKMDVFIPANSSSNTAFVLFIHGGAWSGGDKADMRAFQDTLSKLNIASASMNYRFVNNVIHYQELMSDVQRALDTIFAHKNDWNVTPNDITIAGYSAGGHMALLYAYDFDAANRINAVISLAGPTDLTVRSWIDAFDWYSHGTLQNLVGANYTAGQPLDGKFYQASPIFQIKNVPVLMIHGTQDPTVPYAQSTSLHDSLQALGIASSLVPRVGAAHDLQINNQANMQLMVGAMKNWIELYK